MKETSKKLYWGKLYGGLLLFLLALFPAFKLYTTSQQDNVKEAAIRDCIKPRYPKFSGTYFIAFNGHDPSDRFMQRFQGNVSPVKKDSEAIKSKNQFQETVWTDPTTGVRGTSLYIGDVSWHGPFKATVIIAYPRASFKYTLVWKGRWVKEKMEAEEIV